MVFVIYSNESQLYKDYIKHPIYNYPIKCKHCNSNVSFTENGLKCDCQSFEVTFSIGIKVI